MQPAFQHTATHRRDGAIQHGSHGIFNAAAQIQGDFQITTRGGIHDDAVLLALHGNGANMRQGGTLSIFYVLEQATGGAQPARRVFHAKACQVPGAELHI